MRKLSLKCEVCRQILRDATESGEIDQCGMAWVEGKYALNWTRLSCHDFTDNQVCLQLFALAYNLGNFLRRLALPKKIMDWSLSNGGITSRSWVMLKTVEKLSFQTWIMVEVCKNRGPTVICKGEYFNFWRLWQQGL